MNNTDGLYQEAINDDPSGINCHFCGKLNDFWDDCGWFYIQPEKEGPLGVCCRACWEGPRGKAHVKRFGLGER